MDGENLRVVIDDRYEVSADYGEFGAGSTLNALGDSGYTGDFSTATSVSLVYDDGESSVSLATAEL